MDTLSSLEQPLAAIERSRLSRRGFFNGLMGVSAAALIAGCDTSDDNDGAGVTLDFSTDFGVLNYAYALEQLEAAFYTQVVKTPYSGISADERALLGDIQAHEVIHRDFFKAALGSNAVGSLMVDFSSINFNDRASVLGTARAFEDLGVSAYNGAGRFLKSADYLTIAGKVVSVEARHAAVIRALLAPGTDSFANLAYSGAGIAAPVGSNDALGLDGAATPAQVLAIAGTYVKTSITLKNAA